MKNLKKWLIILFVLLIIIVVIMLLLQKRSNVKNYENKHNIEQIAVEEKEIKLVDNPIMYFTVRSCAEKYINYLADKDAEVVYNLIDSKYKKQFSITKENVFEHVEQVYETSNLEIDKMYIEKLDSNNEIYYIKGSITETTSQWENIYGETKELNLTVNINHDNMTFTIVPFGYGGVLYE